MKKGLVRKLGVVYVVWDEPCNICGKMMKMSWPRDTVATHLLMGGWMCHECCPIEERAAIVLNMDTGVLTVRADHDTCDGSCEWA